MSAGIRVSITGADAALATLRDVAQRLAEPLPLWDAVGLALEESTRQRFLDQREPGGSAWPPSLRARLEGGITLTDSARLRDSITHNASNSGVEVGTNVLYAAIHQFGGTIRAKTEKGLFIQFGARGKTAKTRTGKTKSGKWRGEVRRPMQVTIPARPFLGIDDSDEARITEIATRWLEGSDAR